MYKSFFKRLFDLILSIIALPFWFIILIIIGSIIFLEDKGPIFYNASRIGKNGKIFKMYKFRSMEMNAPDIRLEDGSTYNAKDDPRVTTIGKFIRKTSIDELPQILNILKGDMSFIGPRPDPVDWLERYDEETKVFLTVRPGISGYSQAYFRNSADGYEKMKHDVYYAKNISFSMDAKIFILTLINILFVKNIYKPEQPQLYEKEVSTKL